MSTTQIRRVFLYVVLALYVLYGLLNIGMTGVLFSGAVGLISFSFDIDFELVAATVVLSGIGWHLLMNRRKEGFADKGVPAFQASTQQGIVKRIQQLQGAQPQGVLSSHFAEGFADAGATEATSVSSTTNTTTPPPTASSGPAPTNAPTTTPQLAASLPSANQAAANTPPAQPKEDAKKTETSGFTDRLTDGMFKLGSIPPDAVGGSHIDVGTTMINALNALKPDQIKSMTDDTRKLLETQKSLMGMLQSIKPMLQDGKELMGTFQEMFGSAAPK
jgi:hypothetical protein